MNCAGISSRQLVLVFILLHNHAPFVKKCPKSVINQTLTSKKVFVIDAGSKNNLQV